MTALERLALNYILIDSSFIVNRKLLNYQFHIVFFLQADNSIQFLNVKQVDDLVSCGEFDLASKIVKYAAGFESLFIRVLLLFRTLALLLFFLNGCFFVIVLSVEIS